MVAGVMIEAVSGKETTGRYPPIAFGTKAAADVFVLDRY
jgi:hypothetical protein